ncbi:putative ubiquitin carboxyl-terminal hydrolase 1 [Naviculisporaceae sp. PSN 640]
MSSTHYSKHFLPLESNADVFNQLLRALGISPDIVFEDIFTLDEPDFLPRPALAVVLIFPTTERYEAHKSQAEATRTAYSGSGPDEPVVWFKQTINNACGMYAILHAVCNSRARQHTQPTKLLELSDELEQAHAAAAQGGDSAVPLNAEDEVDFHYVCFVRSDKDGHIYELDGDSKGPIDTGILTDVCDLLAPEPLSLVKRYLDQEEDNVNFNLMALVHRPS